MFKEILSVTLILFSIIDMPGNIPVIISLKDRGIEIGAGKATIACAIIMILFLFVGELILSLFGVDIQSFAIAGGVVIFIIALEMILDVEFMKQDYNNTKAVSIVPIAFPLIAGAGTLTTILSLRAEYREINIIIGIIINLIFIYAVIKSSGFLQRKLGKQGTTVLRKVFGIILLSISIKLIKSNWLF